MNIFKIPRMEKHEYDDLIKENYICRIAFLGDGFPTSFLSFIFLMVAFFIFYQLVMDAK